VTVAGGTQLRFEHLLRGLPDRVRLLKLSWVKTTFDLSVDGARELVDTGKLRFAFDLSDKGAKRSEIRVWKGSTFQYAELGEEVLMFKEQAGELGRVIEQCLPPGDFFPLAALMRPWDVEGTHLHDLCSAHELTLVPGQQLRAKQSPLVTRASAAGFLKRRRIV